MKDMWQEPGFRELALKAHAEHQAKLDAAAEVFREGSLFRVPGPGPSPLPKEPTQPPLRMLGPKQIHALAVLAKCRMAGLPDPPGILRPRTSPAKPRPNPQEPDPNSQDKD